LSGGGAAIAGADGCAEYDRSCVSTVVLDFIVSGSVADFTAIIISALKEAVAQSAGVPVAQERRHTATRARPDPRALRPPAHV